jgi:4-hydroxy-3-methylbut-2-enyl diphosphate reductase IspH
VKIILANPRGFCAGVNMAIESLERALELFGTPLYVYHEIVHNRPVVERFRKRGVTFVDGIDEVPEGATVLYSAHGVAPAIRAAAASRRRPTASVRRRRPHRRRFPSASGAEPRPRKRSTTGRLWTISW